MCKGSLAHAEADKDILVQIDDALSVNPSGDMAEIFWDNYVTIKAIDALGHSLSKNISSSSAIEHW